MTWLYGPLHSAVDPVPPPKISTPQDRLGLETSTVNSFGPAAPTATVNRVPLKPILKHRSIFEMLTHHMPASPINDGYIEFDDTVGPGDYFPAEPASGPSPSRPAIPHTKSDTNLLASSLRTRKSSPQGTDDHNHQGRHQHGSSPPARTPSTSGSPHRAPSDAENGKRHISFNTFVEQCIAIEKPADQPSDDDASSEDEMDDDDEESDEDGVLEFRTRSGSMPLPPAPKKPNLVRHHSHSTSDRSSHAQHVTIAPIAPTILKSSESFPGLSPTVVFVPPNGSVYSSVVPPVQFQLDEEVPFTSARRGRGSGTASPSSSSAYTAAAKHSATHFDGDSDDTPDLGFGDQFRSGSGTASPRGRRDGTGAARYAATGTGGRRHQRSSPSQSPEPTAAASLPVGSASRPVDISGRGHLQGTVSSSPDTLSPEPYPTRGRTTTTTTTTTPGSYNGHSSSSNERSESRGRTSVRGSSSSGLSDRSRSGSRHRVGESSPIGSLSPNPSRSSLSAVVATAATGTSSSPSPPSPRSPPETSSASGAQPAQQTTLKSAMKQRSADFVRPSLVINRDQLEATAGAQSNSGGASDVSTDRHDYWADAPGQAPHSMPSRVQPASARSGAVDPQSDDGLVGRAVSSARGMLRGILFNTPPTAAATAQD